MEEKKRGKEIDRNMEDKEEIYIKKKRKKREKKERKNKEKVKDKVVSEKRER